MTQHTPTERTTVYVSTSSEARAMRSAKTRLMSIAVFFILCYTSLGLKVIDAVRNDRSIGTLISDAWHGVESAKDDTMETVRMMSGEALIDRKQWQPSVPAVVMPRQNIVDRHGVVLASSVATRSVYARPAEIGDPQAVLAKLASIIPDINKDISLRRLSSSAKFVWLKRHITPAEQEALLWAGIPGVYLHDDYHRIYPHGRLMAHALGYINVDGQGLAGAEKFFEAQLTRDDKQAPIKLSLDVRMQHVLRDALLNAVDTYQANAATGAIFHIPTGQARALVSLPDYNPNDPMHASSDARFNRLSVGQYELGSSFKALSTAMAMEHGGVTIHDGFDASTPIRFKGNTIRDFHAKNRWLSVPEIMVYSSNIGTVKMVEQVDVAVQRDFLTRMGMFDEVGIEWHERSVPSTAGSWRPVERATISYGHGIAVTPLHLIRSMMAVTGRGQYRDLTMLDGVTKDAQSLLSPDVSRQVNRMMRAVVQHGTASKADVAGYAVGAKTGTANKAINGRYHREKKISSIVAAFPMPAPEYMVFIMLDEPKGTKQTFNYATAGWVAAPAVAEVITAIAPMIGMPPVHHTPVDQIDAMINQASGQPVTTPPYVQRTTY